MKFIETAGDRTLVQGVDRQRHRRWLLRCSSCMRPIFCHQDGLIAEGYPFHRLCFEVDMDTLDLMHKTEAEAEEDEFAWQMQTHIAHTPDQVY